MVFRPTAKRGWPWIVSSKAIHLGRRKREWETESIPPMLPLDPKVQGLVKKVATPLEAVEKVRNVVLRRGGKKKKKECQEHPEVWWLGKSSFPQGTGSSGTLP